MPSIRRAKIQDLHEMQSCNLWCLPENYNFKYYLYHYLNFSSQICVAEENDKIVGYVLSKMDDQNDDTEGISEPNGHITSLSILRTHRRLGLAYKLMSHAHNSMDKIQDALFVSLHVRVSNRAALGLYRDKLKYQVHDVQQEYYANGQNAYKMRKFFKQKPEGLDDKKKKK